MMACRWAEGRKNWGKSSRRRCHRDEREYLGVSSSRKGKDGGTLRRGSIWIWEEREKRDAHGEGVGRHRH